LRGHPITEQDGFKPCDIKFFHKKQGDLKRKSHSVVATRYPIQAGTIYRVDGLGDWFKVLLRQARQRALRQNLFVQPKVV
jgi:hypothetical protein